MVDTTLGLALVFNGTIYNYRELRANLAAWATLFLRRRHRGHPQGLACLGRLRRALHGMFAFAIWDSATARLFLARDRFGIKPLYWSWTAARLRFASSIPGPAGGGRRGHHHRPGRAAPPLHPARRGAGAAHHPATACASCPRPRLTIDADGKSRQRSLLAPGRDPSADSR